MGLAAGGHAIGIKSVGACVPSFGAAGGDFAPHGYEQAFLQGSGPHVGHLHKRARGRRWRYRTRPDSGHLYSLFTLANEKRLLRYLLPDAAVNSLRKLPTQDLNER